ncbi:MAG TPA: hypothetical protein VN577_19970 [Terriglobales bacterium]|nr:hypothetical protein [Terriglobales bacterium]
MIEVAKDYEGLSIAARELLEEELHAPDDDRTRKSAEQAANREAVLRSLKERRTLSPGYYVRARYLFDLDRKMTVIQFGLSDVTPSEINGVLAIRQAKNKFLSDHPECPYCGALQMYSNVPQCRRCRKKFRGAE